ncbi:MAG: hypothetical protein K2J14_00205 [Treponemataceae bacterium]|nr:hypothetical protein [Treponemataceae bacterium]
MDKNESDKENGVQNAQAYAFGDSPSIAMYVNAGKLTDNGNNAQFNTGTKIYVPVSAGSVLTVTAYDANYAKNIAVSSTAMTTATHSYTVTAAGFVVVEATGSSYIKTITVTNITRNDVLDILSDAPSHVVTATLQN